MVCAVSSGSVGYFVMLWARAFTLAPTSTTVATFANSIAAVVAEVKRQVRLVCDSSLSSACSGV